MIHEGTAGLYLRECIHRLACVYEKSKASVKLTSAMLFDCLFLVVFGVQYVTLGLGSEPAISREDYTRQTKLNIIQGSSMLRHLIKSMEVKNSMECVFECLDHPSCQSINYQTQGSPRHLCELNNNTLASKPGCRQSRPGFDYYAPKEETVNPCLGISCKNGAVCSAACNPHGYQCVNCSAYNTRVNCDGWTVSVSSCKDIYEKTSHRRNMAYTFVIDGNQVDIFCHMTEITGCGTGGWTMTMKIDGARSTFDRSSSHWSNKIAYHPGAGKTGLDSRQTKMPSYWGVSFKAICVGFTVNGVTNFATITYTATSLYDIIADGNQRAVTLLGKSKWQSMIAGSSLQTNCNREGFNLGNVRIGIMSNNENDCVSPDSFVGYGGSVFVSCGNQCSVGSCSNGQKLVRALGYILVK